MSRAVHIAVAALIMYAMFRGYQHYDPLLPTYLAQHFDGSGEAKGFATHNMFWSIGLGTIGVVFISIHLPALCFRSIPVRWVSLPNKEHWLSSGEREASLAYLESSLLIYGNFLLAWMGYVFWRVCESNVAKAPLDGFIEGMIVMVVVTTLWLVLLLKRFSRAKIKDRS